MKENLEKITLGEAHLGKDCLVCQETIKSADEVVACPRCRSVHHANCWKAKGGCGKTGCPQIAKAIIGERPQGDGPPPPVSKKVIFGSIVGVVALIMLAILWPKPPDPAMGRTKIVVLGEAYYDLTEEMIALADEFNATHEEIYIDLQLLPPGSVEQKLVVLIAAQDAPDVIAIDYERYDYFIENEALLPLGEDEHGETIYGVQHPGQLTNFVVWGNTFHPTQAVEVLYYFADNIAETDLELLKELNIMPFPSFGF